MRALFIHRLIYSGESYMIRTLVFITDNVMLHDMRQFFVGSDGAGGGMRKPT